MMRKRSGRLFALLVAVLLVSAACTSTGTLGGPLPGPAEAVDQESSGHADDDVVEHAGVDRVIEVELSEFAIAADSFEFAPGETIEFVVINTGVVEHEFRLSNQDRVDEHVAGGHEDHDDGAMTDEEMAAMDDGDADHDDGAMTDDEMAAMDDGDADHDDGEDADHDHEDADDDGEDADHVEGEMTDDEMEAMDDGDADHDDEDASDHDDDGHGEEAVDAVLILAAGETGTLIFSFPDNDHDYTAAVCLIPGHYEAGMTADLAVEA